MRSPGRKPACAAGVGGAPGGQPGPVCDEAGTTHSLTALTTGCGVATPKPMSTIANSTIARIRFMNGPASMTMIRCQGLRVQNWRSSSPGSKSRTESARTSSTIPWNGPDRRLRPMRSPGAGGIIPIIRM